ncbi:MAG: tetratricopeptide repeat protein [Proteobacteria bacterium]|nr:tetratricopeptide repeat protein [Pseudomonadota bacterium]
MSYIHEALLKAQKEKDARHPRYQRTLSDTAGKPGIFSGRAVWMISFGVILLAFALYSWLDFKGNKTVPASEVLRPEAQPRSEDLVKAEECYERARHLHKIGRLEDARRLYEKTLMLDPGSVCALNNLGVLYMQDKNYSEAQNSFEHAIQKKPDYVDPYYNLACLHALKGETIRSLAQLKKAISLDTSVREWARKDRDLQNLKGMPGFEEVIGDR